ncbi:jg21921 [Pararge aegeria aegeria]|uniref:Jg21921 protein n=1 Tax=Pararge aegeria aegeria TaxID=348720 RepID=A0A8S4QG21_9NEOP|nr:jg21921 [Pararge aegeria aegeria]
MDRAQSRVFFVDIKMPYDENLVRVETEKKRKYLDLAHEVTDTWHLESTETIPIVISANGLIPVSLAHYLTRLGFRGSSLAARMQKVVLLDPARIVRRFLSLSTCPPARLASPAGVLSSARSKYVFM